MNPFQPGAEIHSDDPFADRDKSDIRRLRGRFSAAVSVWTTPGPAGLTVSSMLVADGSPGRILGLVDEESDFWDALSESRRFAVTALTDADQQLADRFAGLMPAPGGLFATGAWTGTGYGPVPADAGTWAGCRLDGARAYGYALLVEATIETVEVGPDARPLLHYRGHYRELTG